MANLEVRIRHENESVGVPIAEIPFRKEAVDSVIPLMQSWGLVYEGTPVRDDMIIGQFYADANSAYFEVVIPAGSES